MMKKYLLLNALVGASLCFGQFTPYPDNTQEHTSSTTSWTYGGYAGIGGGSGGTSLYLSPRAGYTVTPDLEVGVAGNYIYQTNRGYKTSMLGIGPFANYYIKRRFFLHALFQQYFINIKDKRQEEKFSKQESALYLGAGYMQKLGFNAYMQFGLSYNILYSADKSHFTNGFVPYTGIVFGL